MMFLSCGHGTSLNLPKWHIFLISVSIAATHLFALGVLCVLWSICGSRVVGIGTGVGSISSKALKAIRAPPPPALHTGPECVKCAGNWWMCPMYCGTMLVLLPCNCTCMGSLCSLWSDTCCICSHECSTCWGGICWGCRLSVSWSYT